MNTDILLLLINELSRMDLVSLDSICINCMIQFNRTSNMQTKIETRRYSFSAVLSAYLIFLNAKTLSSIKIETINESTQHTMLTMHYVRSYTHEWWNGWRQIDLYSTMYMCAYISSTIAMCVHVVLTFFVGNYRWCARPYFQHACVLVFDSIDIYEVGGRLYEWFKVSVSYFNMNGNMNWRFLTYHFMLWQ